VNGCAKIIHAAGRKLSAGEAAAGKRCAQVPQTATQFNVGSVGQDRRAGYALYDYQNRLLVHRRVEYDIDRAQARFKKVKLPARNASRLKKGQ